VTDIPQQSVTQAQRELDPGQTEVSVARTEHPATAQIRAANAQIRHLQFDPFGNPFLDRDFENDW
jgi:hypothetical protein